MGESTMETLARGLERVERENRRLKKMGLAALAGVVALVLMGQARPTPRVIRAVQIEATRFVLSNPRGKVLGGFEIRRDGTPMLFLDHAVGRRRAPGFMVAVQDNMMSVNLFAHDSKHQVAIAADKIILKGSSGEDRVVVLAHKKGIPLVALNDKDENHRAMLLVTPDGEPFLAFRTKDGKTFWSAP
ncbi:MAG: hypothetical protein ACE5IQ_10300 [Candidatus Methylomirabilales bacterium]